jgi:hypothetical protein
MSVEMNMPTMKRPGGVTVVGFLIILAAIFNIFMGVWLFFAAFGENPEWTDAFGNTQTVSTFYLWFNGLLMIFLGLIYFWLSKLTFLGRRITSINCEQLKRMTYSLVEERKSKRVNTLLAEMRSRLTTKSIKVTMEEIGYAIPVELDTWSDT